MIYILKTYYVILLVLITFKSTIIFRIFLIKIFNVFEVFIESFILITMKLGYFGLGCFEFLSVNPNAQSSLEWKEQKEKF